MLTHTLLPSGHSRNSSDSIPSESLPHCHPKHSIQVKARRLYVNPFSDAGQVRLRITALKGPRARAYCSKAGPKGLSALVTVFEPPLKIFQ